MDNVPKIADSIPQQDVDTYPPFIVALNRLARLGKASRYPPSGSTRWCSFVPTVLMQYKWSELADVERIILVYRGN
jgi:hypothetical protein